LCAKATTKRRSLRTSPCFPANRSSTSPT
jgi:hypothetical protein